MGVNVATLAPTANITLTVFRFQVFPFRTRLLNDC